MKIVMGVSHYPPKYAAGVEMIAQRSARWLAERGHTVEVVCVENIDSDRHLSVSSSQTDGITIHRLGLRLAGTGEHLGLRYRDEAVRDWFSTYLSELRPDVFHSQSCYLLTGSCIEAAFVVGVPVVVSLHDYWFLCPRIVLLRSTGERCVEPATVADCSWCLMAERRRYRWLAEAAKLIRLDRIQGESDRGPLWLPLPAGLTHTVDERQRYLKQLLWSAEQVISLAPFARELLVAQGMPPTKIRVIPSGMDQTHWQSRPRDTQRAGLRIGYLGQVAPHKGVHLLIKAFQRLRVSTNPPELVIHGDGTRFPRYLAQLQKLAGSDNRIRFGGRYNNHDVSEILSSVDVLVVPSVWVEVRPLVIMEAFAAGVPVVTSRLPNLREQVRDEVDGLLFEPEDIADLARQLQRLVDDPALVDRLAQGIAPLPSIDDEMLQVEGVYRHAMDGAGEPVGALARSAEDGATVDR